MIKVRYGCFETNSSSTHSLIIANDNEYKKLNNRELFIDYNDFITREEAVDILISNGEGMEDFCKDYGYEAPTPITKEWLMNEAPADTLDALLREFTDGICSLETYFENEYLESYEESYTTEHGDHIHIFGLYGHEY